MFTRLPLAPLALRMEAALPAEISEVEGTALDLLLLDDDLLELAVEELAVLEEVDAAGFLGGWIG
jgi:hypothetical protein